MSWTYLAHRPRDLEPWWREGRWPRWLEKDVRAWVVFAKRDMYSPGRVPVSWPLRSRARARDLAAQLRAGTCARHLDCRRYRPLAAACLRGQLPDLLFDPAEIARARRRLEVLEEVFRDRDPCASFGPSA